MGDIAKQKDLEKTQNKTWKKTWKELEDLEKH